MPPPPVARTRGETERRGEHIFESLGCAGCHEDTRGTFDLGAGKFAAPSLRFVGERGPYFHDGQYGSLFALLRGAKTMQDTSRLSDGDLRDLVAYLRTL